MKRAFAKAVLALMLTAIGSAPGTAHHSFAMFDSSKVATLAGTVTQFQWGNPHILIEMMTMDQAQSPVLWSFQGASVSVLARMGWNRKTIKAGDRVAITFNPLKNGERGGSFLRIKFADGREVDGAYNSGYK